MKYILGAGISGLVCKYYNPEYKIISPEIGGQITKHNNLLMTFHVHNTPVTKELLDGLKIKHTEKQINIFYYYDKKVVSEPNSSLKAKAIKNKIAEYDYDSNFIEPANFSPSLGGSHLSIFDVDIDRLVKKLTPKDKNGLLHGKVKLINNNRKFLLMLGTDEKLKMLPFEKMVSTIPANNFFFMLYNYRCGYSFNYLPSTYVLSKDAPPFYDKEGIYYVCDTSHIYNRVQPYQGGFVYEITGLPTEEQLHSEITNIVDIERRYVGIIRDTSVDNFRNIRFIGRNAEWNSSIHLEEAIAKSKELKNYGF